MPTDGANAVPPGIKWVELKVTLGAGQVDAGLAGFALEPGPAEQRLEQSVQDRGLVIAPKQETKTTTVLTHLAEVAAGRR